MKLDLTNLPPKRRMGRLGDFLLGSAIALIGFGIPAIAVVDYAMTDSPGTDNRAQLADAAPPNAGEEELAAALAANIASIAPGSGSALSLDDPAAAGELAVAAGQTAAALEGVWRVQLASLKNHKNAETAWRNMQQANPDLLAALTLHVHKAELASGDYSRLQAGPLDDRETAVNLCSSLQARHQDCLVVSP